ncbi:MAG TPA: YhjD/YihY/BrkB family envelope integrity protein, partial [Candidatus Dormibacteraeota bacterium]
VLKRVTSWRPVQVLMAYGQSQGGNYAASLSFNAFLAMFPLILGVLAIVGVVVSNHATQQALYNGIVSVFPSDAHAEILKALEHVHQNAGILGIISIVGLLWSGTSLFASMEFARTEIFGTKQRDIERRVAGRAARRDPCRGLLTALSAVRTHLARLRYVWTAVRPLFSTGCVARFPEPVHSHRRRVQQDAPR